MKNKRSTFHHPRRNPSLSYVPWALVVLLTGANFAVCDQTAPSESRLQTVRGGAVPASARLRPIGQLSSATTLNLAIGLPLRNQAALTNLLRALYDPASPEYRKYLTTEQFTERFGPTASDYEAVVEFAKASGFRVTTHANRMLVSAQGTALQIEKALHVHMRTYQHPTENRTFYAPDTAPALDLAVPVLGVSGLDNYSPPQPQLKSRRLLQAKGRGDAPNQSPTNPPIHSSIYPPHPSISSSTQPSVKSAYGSGPSGTYMGKDFRAAYVPGSSLMGSGQTVGLLEFDGYNPSDVTYYEEQAGLPIVPLVNVLLDYFPGTPTSAGGWIEVCLDIEVAVSTAPGLSQVIVYMAGPDGSWHDILNRMATDNLAKQISCSWLGGGPDTLADQIFQQMAAQGQTFFSASGDYDAFTGPIPFPGDTPYITQVGGTTLTTSGPGGSWVSETVWNWGGGIGSSGGISTQYPIPAWQMGINMTAAQGSTTMRNVPDVAAVADSVYVRALGVDWGVAGTSCAAPLWAGFLALVNQRAVNAGEPTMGFLNPTVYALAQGARYGTAFHDITAGDNTWSGSPTKFYAETGYDLCTGWGTPAGIALINGLATPDALLITPPVGSGFSGLVGGPFIPNSQVLTLTNLGAGTINWTLSNTSAWLTASPSGGTLAPGGASTAVTVTPSPSAASLPAGAYGASIIITNLSDGVVQGVQFALTAVGPPTITNQPADQPVNDGATAVFNVQATGTPPLYFQWQAGGINLIDVGGDILGSTSNTLSIANVSPAYLGGYSVLVSNMVGVVTSRVAQLTITPSVPVIVTQPTNQSVFLGHTAAFGVGVEGSPPFGFQWSLNGTNLSGATAASLVLTNIQFSQAGTYEVLVTNSLGATLSSNAVLTVEAPPPCAQAPPGLLSWWRGEADASDAVGTNNGTLVGGVSFTDGEVGQCFAFNGTSAYVDLGGWFNLETFSIAMWVNPAASQADYANIIDNNASDTYSWSVQYDNIGMQFHWGFGRPGNVITFNLVPNTWQYLVLTMDAGGTALVYLDGQVQGAATFLIPIAYPGGQYLRLGQWAGGNRYFKGLLDEVDVYNRVLTTNEVLALYNCGVAGKCSTPISPVITAQPANLSVPLGATAALSVTVSGTPPSTYQWSFNGADLPGATTNPLVITNAQLTNAGTYAVSLDNSTGAALSSNAVLTVNSCVTAPAGLVSWWRAEGNANDAVGTNYGTLIGVTFTNGEVGQCFSFSGSFSEVDLGSWFTLQTFSIAMWVKPAAAQNSYANIIDNNGTGAANWGVQYDNVGLQFHWGIAPGTGIPFALTPNVWQYLALTLDSAGVARVYLNGQLQGSETISQPIPYSGQYLRLGQYGGDGRRYFIGGLDEVDVYNRALGQTEIVALYDAATAGKCVVPFPPIITTQPTSQAALITGTATFTVAADSAFPLSYQWSFNGGSLPGATNASLVISNLQATQAGTYTVSVGNSGASVLSSNAVLTLIGLHPVLYDAAAGFSASSNPAGVWSYGFSSSNLGSVMTLCPEHTQVSGLDMWRTNISLGAPSVFHNGTTSTLTDGSITVPPGGLGLHPGPNGQYALVRFTSPLAAQYLVAATFSGLDMNGTTTDVHVLTNSLPIFNGTVTGYGPGSGPTSYSILALNAGDRLDFAVGYGSDRNFTDDATGLSVQIRVNHPPIAGNVPAVAQQNQAMSIPFAKMLRYCSDPDGDLITIAGVSSSSTNGGPVVLGGNNATYTPPPGFVGADSFTYSISDEEGATAIGSVLVSVRSTGQVAANMLPPTILPASTLPPIILPSGFQISFLGLPAYTYSLQRATSASGPWATLSRVTADSSGMGTFDDTEAPPATAFYRATYP